MSDPVKSAHTPGPWRAEWGHEGSWHVLASHQWTSGALAAATVARTAAEGIGPFSGQREANAHLIAAAPELLEALKAAQLWTTLQRSRMVEPSTHPQAIANIEADMALIAAAIAKAEGR